MKRLAIIFAVAVIAPSLVLAWLALRSLRDQQFVLERQQFLLCQNIADSLARDVDALVEERQREFAAQVESLLATNAPTTLASQFDDQLRRAWPAARVGFVVSLSGTVYSPSPLGRSEARQFRLENDQFLCNRVSAEVYWGNVKGGVQAGNLNTVNYNANNSFALNGGLFNASPGVALQNAQLRLNGNSISGENNATLPVTNATGVRHFFSNAALSSDEPLAINSIVINGGRAIQNSTANGVTLANNGTISISGNNSAGSQKIRSVTPQQGQLDLGTQGNLALNQGVPQIQQAFDNNDRQNISKLASTEAEFRQLVGDATEGAVARFLQNRLNVMLWYRPPRAPELVFGALLDLAALREELRALVRLEPALAVDLAVALLDDGAKPVAVTPANFTANWKRPFVATEVGGALPHWELAVYLRNPNALGHAARTATLTLALLVGVLVVAIVVGSWLIVGDVRRQLAVARQKTDFVSNVSHELKTPLTAIRMFAELLSEGRAAPEKQRQYFSIITAEAARLTRLINNVLDFARFDRGEKQFELQPCDLAQVVGETVSGYRAHLEAAGFTLEYEQPAVPIPVRADRDALAQVVVNLLSNAEKYSNGSRQISVTLATRNGAIRKVERGLQADSTSVGERASMRPEGRAPGGFVELSVLDRGPGVPRGCEEKIFEQFFRAHDSLASGIQGSGLGLTLARQIARAHGGDVIYSARDGGGSCFTLRLPLADNGHFLST